MQRTVKDNAIDLFHKADTIIVIIVVIIAARVGVVTTSHLSRAECRRNEHKAGAEGTSSKQRAEREERAESREQTE
jgi:cell division protein FtsL